ncbi:MAG: hypothetical protein K2I00_10500 [Ruminococcus sp.]|nr:hypothetical protein [Ruminococcus sp.]
MPKKAEKSRGAKALYSRREHLIQAKKDKKYPVVLSSFTYFLFVLFAVVSDFLSIQQFQDKISRGDKVAGDIITAALIFGIDVVAPITLPHFLQAHFKQKKLRIIMLISIISSVGLLIVLNIIQKIIGADVMLAGAGETVIVGKGLKNVTLILYAVIPIASTVALTAISLRRDNYKIYQMMRYCVLAETDVQAQLNELNDNRVERDEEKLKAEDDIRFITAVEHLKSKAQTMFNVARIILAEGKSPEEAERILNSEPLPHITPYDEAIRMNPNHKVSFPETDINDDIILENKEEYV